MSPQVVLRVVIKSQSYKLSGGAFIYNQEALPLAQLGVDPMLSNKVRKRTI
jgi:hypothetical protein